MNLTQILKLNGILDKFRANFSQVKSESITMMSFRRKKNIEIIQLKNSSEEQVKSQICEIL